MRVRHLFPLLLAAVAPAGCRRAGEGGAASGGASRTPDMKGRVVRTDDEWKRLLTPEQYAVLRRKGTERAFSGKYWDHHEKGVYKCAACATPLYRSAAKFESGTGWPSFFEPVDEANLAYEDDRTLFMKRTEVLCAGCGGHLGHVFDDGPRPTGKRHCINSVCLAFEPEG